MAEKLKKQYFTDKKIDNENKNSGGKKSKNKIGYWNEHLDKKYGKVGTATRTEFESKAQAFVIGELLKEERAKANLTQEALAERTGTKKATFQELKMAEQTFNFQLYSN